MQNIAEMEKDMRHMTFANIQKACGGELHALADVCNIEATSVVVDSRKVTTGGIFIATKGERVDGHDFIEEVYEKGALGVICEKAPQNAEIPYLLVKDSFEYLKTLAAYYRNQLNLKVVGITGSVGKTSTKEFVASVLKQKYNVLKTQGNFNNEVGLPLTVLSIREEHEIAVLEMGISDFGEMTRLAKIARPDVCVITNIGQCHLENLKSREGILKAKTEVFEYMNPEGTVFLNGDDDMLATISNVHGKRPIHFGISSRNDVYADGVESLGLFGSRCILHSQQESIPVEIPLPGEHMIINAACATAVGNVFGLTTTQIADGMKEVPAVSGRSNIIRHKKNTVIDDCYNANPVSMKAAIDLLSLANTRKVAILGDMFELGVNEKELHFQVGAYAATHKIDIILCVGNLSKYMYEGACSIVNTQVYHFTTREELLENIHNYIQQDDTILVKASHGMGFHEVVEVLTK